MKSALPPELPILDPAFKADPVPFYETIRQRYGPVAPVRLPSGTEAWLVTGHAAARDLLRDQRLVKQRIGCDGGADQRAGHPLFAHLLMRDPPDHARLRALVNPFFTTRQVTRLEAMINSLVTGLLDEIAPTGRADLIASLATPLPLRVMLVLLDLPAREEPVVRDWMDRLNEADLRDPDSTPAIAAALHAYILEFVNRRHAANDSIMGGLRHAHAAGTLTRDEWCAMVFLLLGAGYETTSGLVGSGVHALLRKRSEWSKLCADPALAGSLVEEVLRMEAPLEVSTPRYAACDLEVCGAHIRRGDLVLVGLAAANRDPHWLPDGREFRIDRQPVPRHLSFGHGLHRCLGAALARLEGRIVFRQLSARFPDLELAVPTVALRWREGLVMRGLESLPVRFRPRPPSRG